MTMRSAFALRTTLAQVLLQASLPSSALSFQSSTSSLKSFPNRCINLAARSNILHTSSPWLRHQQPHSVQRLSFLPSTALMSTSTSKSTMSSCKVLGGDYAGLSATFSSKNGELVPVPEHLIPESMLEWGQIPSNFEVLNSEDLTDDNKSLERTTITVLPEVGCGIDNLEVTKKIEKFGGDDSRLESWNVQDEKDREVSVVDRTSGQTKLDLETTFQVDSSETDEDGNGSQRRIRVSLLVDVPSEEGDPTVSKLITLQVEKQTSPESTQGAAWYGTSSNSGGLDGRTVMNTIGKDIVYGDVFAVKKIEGGGDLWDLCDGDVSSLNGVWTKSMISPENNGVVEVQRSKSDFCDEEGTDTVAIRLPQNIMVRYGRGLSPDKQWAIEVSHFGSAEDDGKHYLQRRVVSRSFDASKSEEVGSLCDVSYWMEKKAS